MPTPDPHGSRAQRVAYYDALDLADRHTRKLYEGQGAAWVECSCGWRSVILSQRLVAQMLWAQHIHDVEHAEAEVEAP